VSKKRTGNTGKSRAKAANSRKGTRASKVVVWVALLAIILLIALSVIR
jgi:hypothetical protein